MNRVERESFLKSFLLFFTSLSLLIATLFYINFTKEVQTLDEKLLSEMRVCSFDLKCVQFHIDFIEHKSEKLYSLYKDDNGLSSYYPIPGSTKNIMLLRLDNDKYNEEINQLKSDNIWKFSAVLAIVFVLSILFSIYALYPLRNALLLTQEFIKDILHDFNTPLSTLRLNSSMLKREIGENEKVDRIEQSVANVLSLQKHLRSYLQNHDMHKEEFNLKTILKEQVYLLEKNYTDINFSIDAKDIKLLTNKEAFARIVSNILTNAAKYNKKNGFVKVVYEQSNKTLNVIDSGKGIKNPKKIFDRFYKEQDRGIGIGLHIVKKLCDELSININVKSELENGTTFSLELSKLTLR
ncbi:MAG: HAMP domain-containing sensor histidine kinase [Sulfurimonas sp.]|nr:HAMP domain-containing sensor histidine kinase [Sulfurimonas sp.]